MHETCPGAVVKAVEGVERMETLIALSLAKETTALDPEPPDWAK
jgi:hypothetical protein